MRVMRYNKEMHANIDLPPEVSTRDLIVNMLKGSVGCVLGRYKQPVISPNGLKGIEEVKLSDDFIDVLMGREVQNLTILS
uniref:Uncharacterized protein n=3 Tax=unclassified Wolbachia TaxID=2640676 RepID=A0A3B0JCT9_9RICK